MHLICLVTLIINVCGDLDHIFLNRFPSRVGLSPGDKKCWMHNFTLASPPIPNIKFLSFVVSEKYVILKICTFSIKNHDFTRKKQLINVNSELALNNSVIVLPTNNYVDRPKTQSAIALTKIILKICTFSIKKNHDFTRKKQ